MALDTLQDLFMIERQIWGGAPAEVLAARKQRTAPLVNGFFDWVHALSLTLGDAIRYAINQEAQLRLHLAHGELPLHNNLSS